MANTHEAEARVTEIRRILCPVDFSEFSASGLAWAAAFAQLFGSDITVLLSLIHISEPTRPY